MKYVGSKNKLAKYIAPIIQGYITKDTKGYLEPFVGGANMIDKIQCDNKTGCDIHEELIELLKYVQVNYESLPNTISEEEYIRVRDNKKDYPKWYIGLVGFCCGFGAKYFGGYARAFKNDGITPRDMVNEAIRNIKKQAPNLKNINFINCSFLDLPKDKIKGYVIYCDPPYRDTTKYATDSFPYEAFYDWCRELSKNNVVLVSEYNMPNDFICVWEKETKANFDSKRVAKDNKNTRTEKLFILKNN